MIARPLLVISRCPDDPEKTIIYIVAHANPGGGVPQWAVKTAVNALAPIEPFKLFHKINENVQRNRPQLRERLLQAEMVGANLPQGRSPRPAGMAQLGYACFWPNGGGVYEGRVEALTTTTNDGSGHESRTHSAGGETQEQIQGETSSSSNIQSPSESLVESL